MPEQLPQISVWGIFTILLIRGLVDLIKASKNKKSNGAFPIHPRKLEIMSTQIDRLHELRDVPTELLTEMKNQTAVLNRIETALNKRNGSGR